jgi:hypothetical protein
MIPEQQNNKRKLNKEIIGELLCKQKCFVTDQQNKLLKIILKLSFNCDWINKAFIALKAKRSVL